VEPKRLRKYAAIATKREDVENKAGGGEEGERSFVREDVVKVWNSVRT
jgi:hypothetical protein